MAKQAYLVRREADGTMRTVQAQSSRGAMMMFVAEHRPPVWEYFFVKPRGSGDWECYRVTSAGVRLQAR